MWLACLKEIDMESKAMGAAMQDSLLEAEAQKQLETPVFELTEQHFKSRYASSRILQQVFATHVTQRDG